MTATPEISPEVLDVLLTYSWPGNIRELRNMIERAVLLCGRGAILPSHLPLEKMRATFGVQQPIAAPATHGPGAVAHGALSAAAAGAPVFTPVEPRDQLTARVRTSALTIPPVPDQDRDQDHGADDHTAQILTERARIIQALAECSGNQTAAARMLGIARRTLINKLELYGISGPRKRR
jgi:two-component system, NtrC family, response regulator AtoC